MYLITFYALTSNSMVISTWSFKWSLHHIYSSIFFVRARAVDSIRCAESGNIREPFRQPAWLQDLPVPTVLIRLQVFLDWFQYSWLFQLDIGTYIFYSNNYSVYVHIGINQLAVMSISMIRLRLNGLWYNSRVTNPSSLQECQLKLQEGLGFWHQTTSSTCFHHQRTIFIQP